MIKILRKKYRVVKRWFKKKKKPLLLGLGIFIVALFSYTSYMQNKRFVVDPATYKPLLDLIARAESNGNYNAYFGNSQNQTVKFTNMTISEVMQWQANYINQGNVSSAVGRYQIINTTLAGLVRELDINTNQPFDKQMQDKLAITLLERRGAESYVNKELTRDQFAANIAKEWAGLPKVIGDDPNKSYYASDGLNKAHVDVAEVQKAIELISPK